MSRGLMAVKKFSVNAGNASANDQPVCERTGCSLNLDMVSSPPKPFLSFSIVTHAAFWLISFGFVFYLSYLNFGTPEAWLRGMLIFCCHLVNFYICYSFLVPRYFEKNKRGEAIGLLLLVLALLTPARYYIEKQFIPVLNPVNREFLVKRGLLPFIIFSELSIATIASLLRLAVSNEERKIKMNELENLHLQTELRFLKAQMNPHFLFNTINNIYSLTLSKSEKAPAALMKLSALLRYMLYETSGTVSLSKEMETLQGFIELHQLKFKEKLNIKIEDEIAGKDVRIEPMLLMPLFENAVKYSGIGIFHNAKIVLKISLAENNRLELFISNNKSDSPSENEAGGIGIANIQKRLQLLYANNYTLVIDDRPDQFSVTLNIPVS